MKAGAALISRLRALGLTKDEASVDTVRYLMRMNRYSSEKARARLGYVPEVTLHQGLERTQPFIEQVMSRIRETQGMSRAGRRERAR